jgi:FixJ family two-component response regulator
MDGSGLRMNAQGRTIAVIDDNLRVLESLVNLLTSFGCKTESYKSAEQFLGSGALSRTSCIVTDVELRQMSGLGLLQYLKNGNSTVL